MLSPESNRLILKMLSPESNRLMYADIKWCFQNRFLK